MAYEATFRLLTPVAMVERHDFVVSDRKLLEFDSLAPVPLLMGEWCTLDSSYKLARAANPGVPPGPWALFTELGRSDTQGIAEGKAPVLFQGSYWAETKLFAGAPALGAALEVAQVTYPVGVFRSGLQTKGVGTNPVIGYVTKLAADNGGWLQFQQTLY